MIGKLRGSPDQLPSSTCPLESSELVSSLTDFEYQAVRVFISVLLIPAPKTLTSTWSDLGTGTLTSSQNSSTSKPPCPFVKTAFIVFGIVLILIKVEVQTQKGSWLIIHNLC